AVLPELLGRWWRITSCRRCSRSVATGGKQVAGNKIPGANDLDAVFSNRCGNRLKRRGEADNTDRRLIEYALAGALQNLHPDHITIALQGDGEANSAKNLLIAGFFGVIVVAHVFHPLNPAPQVFSLLGSAGAGCG